jgi:hypothetical protein
MRILFSVEFEFEHKTYLGIVRVMEQSSHFEYHVRIMNSRLDKWLYGHHIFRHDADGAVTFDVFDCSKRTATLRDAVYESLKARLQSQVVALPPENRRIASGGASYYVHRIGGPDF